MDAIFALRILMKAYREKRRALYVGSLDLQTGSALLFDVVLDTVSTHIQEQPPWLMMYADNIALINENRLTQKRKAILWKDVLENGGLKLNLSKI